MGYEIRIVSSEEFDSLPYKGARGALGLADAENGIAYVRETGVRGLDESTINHEFDELLMSVSPHEEDGIRYKSGKSLGQMLAPVLGIALSFIPGVGPLIGALAGGALGGGTAAHSSSVKPEKYGPVSFGNIALPAATGALSGFGGATMGAGMQTGWANAVANNANPLIGAAKGAIGMTGTAATPSTSLSGASLPLSSADAAAAGSGFGGAALPMSSKAMAAAPSLSSGASTFGSSALAGAAPMAASAPAGQSLLSKFGSYAGDVAKNAGSTLAVNSVVGALSPQAAPAAGQFQESLFPESRTPASNVGPTDLYGQAGALSRFNPNISSGADQYNPVSQSEYDIGLSNLRTAKSRRLSDIFRTPAFRGQSPTENSRLAGQISGLNTGFDKELAKYNEDIANVNLSRQYNAVKKQNSLTDAQMTEFINLAKMDDAAISARAANTPAEIRAIFGQLKAIA